MKSTHLLLILCIALLFSSCSSKLYTTYYNSEPAKTKYYIDNIVVSESFNIDSSLLKFDIDFESYAQVNKYSDKIIKRDISPKWHAGWALVNGILVPIMPVGDALNIVTFGLLGKPRIEEMVYDERKGSEDIPEKSVIKVEKGHIYFTYFLDILPFYMSPWQSFHPDVKMTSTETELNEAEKKSLGFINETKRQHIKKDLIPIEILCNDSETGFQDQIIDINEVALKEYKKGNKTLNFKVTIGDYRFNISDKNIFNYSYETAKYLPEKYSIKRSIKSTPTNADIYILNPETGKYSFLGKTPYTIKSEKSYEPYIPSARIRLKHGAYKDKSISIEGVNESTETYVRLEKIPSGILELTSNKDNVLLFIDEQKVGTISSGQSLKLELSLGKHELIAHKNDYKTYTQTFTIRDNKTTKHAISLVKSK